MTRAALSQSDQQTSWSARLRWLLGAWLALVVRLWVWTLRVRVVGPPAPGLPTPGSPAEGSATEPPRRVFVFWHGDQLPLLALQRSRPTCVLVSWSDDGALQAGVMTRLGFQVVRGSSSRGGAAGLRGLVKALPAADLALAVDGPRGPRERAKPGAVLAARLGGAELTPLGVACARARRLGSWDAFSLPCPGSRVVVACGEPVLVRDTDESTLGALEDALAAVRAQAAAALDA
ncbi:MAG: DUF374 domain-containing protein [Polyangiaceae bacterium]|nr:DUF374 domain-containing protein [Polyangiaceae bacterium]MCW5791939.1 DUF374 domain-containing protein [Polyangiaceae bacterium]